MRCQDLILVVLVLLLVLLILEDLDHLRILKLNSKQLDLAEVLQGKLLYFNISGFGAFANAAPSTGFGSFGNSATTQQTATGFGSNTPR